MGSCFSKAKPKNQNSKANSNSNSKGTDLFFSEQINPSPFCEAKPKNPHLHNFKIDNASLELLRHQPDAFFGVFGLAMSPGHSRPANNKCSVTLLRADTSTTMKIDILDQGTDWYLPYEDNKALCIDVPKNQPNGTLVLTHPMNGCALCVYETEDGKNNRFFHDADGKALKKLGLPPGTDSKIKYRLEEPGYAGANRPLEDARKKVDEEENDKKKPEYPPFDSSLRAHNHFNKT